MLIYANFVLMNAEFVCVTDITISCSKHKVKFLNHITIFKRPPYSFATCLASDTAGCVYSLNPHGKSTVRDQIWSDTPPAQKFKPSRILNPVLSRTSQLAADM